MALIIPGKTYCAICNELIEENDDLIGLPSFCGNRADRLYMFNDAAMHKRCFEQHPDSSDVTRRVEEQYRRAGPGTHKCLICNELISNPDDYIHLGFLVESEEHPLFQFNYSQFHKSCLPTWTDAHRLIDLIEALDRSGKWKGNMLKFLSTQLRSGLDK
jgi:hypothetical protein